LRTIFAIFSMSSKFLPQTIDISSITRHLHFSHLFSWLQTAFALAFSDRIVNSLCDLCAEHSTHIYILNWVFHAKRKKLKNRKTLWPSIYMSRG
jgi:hypothetical protein